MENKQQGNTNMVTGVPLKVMEGVGNKIVAEDNRTQYNCPECGRQVYVVTGAPYRGACVNCLKSKDIPDQLAAGITGVINSFL